MKMKFKVMCLLFIAMTTGLYAQAKKTATKKPAPANKVMPAKKPVVTPTNPNDGIFAELETSKGKIVLVLEYQKTPITVANFVSLAEGTNPFVTLDAFKGKPFYNGLKFHRVINDFMIQGGDPLGNGSGSPGYKFKDEFTDLKHDKAGILSMANSGPTTNGSQFFITHKETSWLNGKHTVFGHVVSGMEVVNAIVQDDVINKITIVRKGAAAKAFNATKVFSDYYSNQDADAKKEAAIAAEKKKKQEADEAEAKRVYDQKYGPVKAAKLASLNKIKSEATTTDSGLAYKIVTKGTGIKPAEKTTVYIHYAGYLEDGSLFDSSYEAVNKDYGKFDATRAAQNGYQPFPFEYASKGGLIPGFLEGLNQMSFGDKATLFIPSKLGYGANGAGTVIPPNANIIFEVELLEKMPVKQ